jgi:isopenicillin N synthase-like dioxygenase
LTAAAPRRRHPGVRALPIIDVAGLCERGAGERDVARSIDRACRDAGFFSITGHGVEPALADRLIAMAGDFFARPEHEKATIAMEHGGLAWRGWFPVGGELTSGVPDRKEGLYFGTELGPEDPRVRAGLPLHGPNLFPRQPAGLRDAVLEWLVAMTTLGHTLMRGVAVGLGLHANWFATHLTDDPTILFRIFHYPPGDESGWGVGEHTDYGLLTILLQDDRGGLQVRGSQGWIDVPPEPGTLVCNIGDMLDRMTAGRYRSTPHRVRNLSGRSRLSFPFFFDPSWDARVAALPLKGSRPADDAGSRWDQASVHDWEGTYGDYLLAKVGKVFPQLRARVL